MSPQRPFPFNWRPTLDKDLIKDHWFRAARFNEPCVYPDCGKHVEEHSESVGEWTDPRHLFIPFLYGCARCGRPWSHSTHWGSRRNRSMWIWPAANRLFHRIKDGLFRFPRCRHFSHRLKLPCFRQLVSSCSGLCDKHYDDCHEGCP